MCRNFTGLGSVRDDISTVNLEDIVTTLIQRTSRDHTRRRNNWGKNLLEFCGYENLMILNGRFGNDKNLGEFTCLSSRHN